MFQLLQLAIVVILLLTSQTNHAAVGRVSEQSGPTEIVRNKKSIPSQVNAGIEMNDTIVTARAKAKLEFEDKTIVNVNEQSKIIIDDFVYDPNKSAGKLSMKVALGTARYASGQIAKNNPQAVDIKTPTASIAVRGTDFTMTVDELGRSLIMLLPSCDRFSCVTGAIEVSTEAGSVLMTQAYQATLVASASAPPSSPVIVTIDQANINNLLIISPPKELQDSTNTQQSKTALDVNFLNQDLLKYDELNKDLLDTRGLLDVNFLDADMLGNMLDASNAALSASQEALLEQNTMLPGYNAGSGLKYWLDDEGKLTLNKTGSHTAQITVSKEQSAVADIRQDGAQVYQKVNSGGTTTITIIQR